MPERLAVAVVIVALAIASALAAWLLAAELAAQFEDLGAGLNHVWQRLQTRLRSEDWGRQLLALVSRPQQSTADGGVVARVTAIFSSSLGALVNVLIVLFMGVYIAVNPQWYCRGLIRLIPRAGRAQARGILDAIGHSLRWWLFGRAIGMIVVGVLTTLGLLWLDVPLALGLGVIAAALDFVPIIGPIAAAVPAVLVALGTSSALAVYVLLLYLAVQLVEGYVLTPLIEQRSVQLPPALTIGAQVLLGVLTGAVGVLVATPLTAAIVVLVQRLYVEDALENPARHEEPATRRHGS